MTEFQDQLIMSGDDQVGDCARAVTASIIGKKTHAVPHFGLLGQVHAFETMVAWLQYKGWDVGCNLDDFDQSPEPLCMLKGFSPRRIYHAVVGDTATLKMVHDPHPSRAGLLSVTNVLYFFRRPKL